jgi:MFS family permease
MSAPVGDPEPSSQRKLFGIAPIKWVFALEYMMQGLANPFQGVTYQPFFSHFRHHYGLTEAATQHLFAQSYLAWSFKPILGFVIDAYGKTRTVLVLLLAAGVVGYLLVPFIDVGPLVFFWAMFALSVCFAATDVAVDRATVVTGAEEAESTGRSKATTVGLNQAICWLAIYGTSIVSALLGGFVAESMSMTTLLLCLSVVPLVVLLAVLRLPKDTAAPIRLTESLRGFWRGLNTGPILSVMLFYFIFNCQPAMGPLWNNYLLTDLRFSQSQVGISESVGYGGYFLGVLLFARYGVRWQERHGMRKLFRIYICLGILMNLTQYGLVDPWFSRNATVVQNLFISDAATARLLYLCSYSFLQLTATSMVAMSTFSLVGAVVPTTAAGSLFAGFMSVSNLAYSFSYASGAWLYEHGLEYGAVRDLQHLLFDIQGQPGQPLSVSMLILAGSVAFLASFLCVHVLPDCRETSRSDAVDEHYPGPERWSSLGPNFLKVVNVASLTLGSAVFIALYAAANFELIAAALVTFFGTTLVRKTTLDAALRRQTT